MTDRSQNDGIPDGGRGGDEDVDLRLGRHVIELLQAMAMAVGFVLASRLPGAEPETA